jgi:hypothetical protein
MGRKNAWGVNEGMCVLLIRLMRLDELPGRLKLPIEVLDGGGPLLDGGGWEDNLVFATD